MNLLRNLVHLFLLLDRKVTRINAQDFEVDLFIYHYLSIVYDGY